VKQFKKLSLTFASLLVVAFSFNFTRTLEANTSFQNKSIEFQLAAIAADDIDDDFGDPEFEKILERALPLAARLESIGINAHVNTFDPHHTSIPFYLQIRNLRI
jgi:hypothetical protein